MNKRLFAYSVYTKTPLLGLLVLLGILPFGGRLFDLPSHFMGQYALGSLCLLPLAVYARAKKPVIAALVVLVFVTLSQIAPFLLPHGAVTSAQSFKILQTNVLFINKDPQPLQQLIASENPDLVVAAEVTPVFAKMFAGLKKQYPYQEVYPDSAGPRGLAVLSKKPFVKVEKTSFDSPGVPSQLFTLGVSGKEITFLSLHPFTPIEDIARRDNEFKLAAASLLKQKPANLVVLGDFNATPYCHAYHQLVSALHLRNARDGQGIYPTWPTFLPTPFLGIPIDNVLVSENVIVRNFSTGPDIGSDHLPTITEIALKDKP